MKLTQLFESSKKEVKQRNPVAQELRANPQFKSKTEIDKKKEVKKGYQKHKNKVDESTDVDTAYVKKVIAQHSDEYKKFLDTGDLMDAPSVYEKLFAYFHFETGEMPYGTAKARDGDPYNWIADKLYDLGLAEQVDHKTIDQFHKKLDKLVHKTFGHSSDEKKENIGEDDVDAVYPGTGDIYGYTWNCKKCGTENEFSMSRQDAQEYIDEWEREHEDDDTYGSGSSALVDALDQGEDSGFHYGSKCVKCGTEAKDTFEEDLDDEARNFVDYIQDQGYKILSQGAGPRGISIEYQDREGGVHQVDFKDGKTFKEQEDVPTQKGRDAKHDVLTPRAKNKVLKQIKHDANKDRRSASKDIERMAKLAGISTASTDESVDQLEATQDLTRQLNPLRGVVGTNTSAQMTAKGLDALSKGQRPTPQQVKAVEPYVSSMAKAMQDPKTSAQMRNIIKKVN